MNEIEKRARRYMRAVNRIERADNEVENTAVDEIAIEKRGIGATADTERQRGRAGGCKLGREKKIERQG